MAHEPKTIHISEDSEIALLLKEADGRPVRLEKGGVAYRLSREELAVAADYDPATLRDAVQTASGMLTPEEGEARSPASSTSIAAHSRPSSGGTSAKMGKLRLDRRSVVEGASRSHRIMEWVRR